MLVQVKRTKVGLEYLENVLKEWGRWGMLSHRITYKRNRQESQRENERSHYLWEGEWGEQMRTLHGLSTSSGPCVFEPVLTCTKEK